jgi:hypothetical protein
MKFSRLGAFTLGVVITAVSVGAVSFANAAGEKQLKACANKKTGVMRYISKGKCKKTERALSWNQMGPQGLAGNAGAKGDTGAAGAKGDTGAAGAAGAAGDMGASGTEGAKGQNLFLVNADGTTVGPVTQANSVSASVLFGGFIWDVQTQSGLVVAPVSADSYFRDESCTTPYARVLNAVGTFANPQTIVIALGTNELYDSTDKVYKMVGKGLTFSSQTNVYIPGYSGCTPLSSESKVELDGFQLTLFELSEISVRPNFLAPLTIVAK